MDGQGNWDEVQKLTGNPSSEGTQFGWSTAIQQNYILVSAPHIFGFEEGEVYFYKRDSSSTWIEEQVIQGSDTVGEDFYGWSVAMHQDEVIVGSPWEDHDENGGNEIDRAGSAYIFKDPTLLGTTDFGNAINGIQLYPNPTQNSIKIESNNVNIANLKLYGISGALLQEIDNIGYPEYSMDISKYSNGIYFASINFEDGSKITKKIIKSN